MSVRRTAKALRNVSPLARINAALARARRADPELAWATQETPLPPGMKEWVHKALQRDFTFAGDVIASVNANLPRSERHRSLADLSTHHPETAKETLIRALRRVNLPDLLMHRKENPLLDLDDPLGRRVVDELDRRVITPTLNRHRTALAVIRDRLGLDEDEVRNQIRSAVCDPKVLARAEERVGWVALLKTVATRRIVDLYRQARRSPSREPLSLHHEDPTAAQALTAVEHGVDLPRFLERLTPTQRKLVAVMRRMGSDYSDSATAQALGVSKQAIQRQHRRLVRRLT